MYFSRIIIASIIGVASIKTTLVAAEDVCAATDEQSMAFFGNIFIAMASMSPECQGDEPVMTPECITEALSIMDGACDATDGMAILAVESEVDCGDLDTDSLFLMLLQLVISTAKLAILFHITARVFKLAGTDTAPFGGVEIEASTLPRSGLQTSHTFPHAGYLISSKCG